MKARWAAMRSRRGGDGRWRWQVWLLRMVRLGLSGVLVWAGVAKAFAPAELAAAIMNFQLVPWPVAVVGAYYLPWLEVVAGVALLVPRGRAAAARVAAGLFSLFTVVWLVSWLRGLDVSCGCFGAHDVELGTVGSGLRAMILAAAAWLLVWRGEGTPSGVAPVLPTGDAPPGSVA